MRTLVIHPEDSPRRGHWRRQRWDLLVDLGKSSEAAAADWEKDFGCPVLRLDSFRKTIDDLAEVGQLLRKGRGQFLDSEGLDWWELTALPHHTELECTILLQRLARELSGHHDLYATRQGWPINALAFILNQDLRTFGDGVAFRVARQFDHYHQILRTIPIPQLVEISLDKYDAHYRWRRLFTTLPVAARVPVVLVPTAYTNVSRVAAAYASMLPDQNFLFVATRRSARQFEPTGNVRLANLACYVQQGDSRQELASLLGKWQLLLAELQNTPALQLLCRLGRLDSIPALFRDGLAVRDLWRGVLEREPVTAVFCGDDSNRYTRIPVLLARKAGIPTVDFHHGALDGRCLLKTLASDTYLAKTEMERDYLVRVCGLPPAKIVLGAPRAQGACSSTHDASKPQSHIVLFSEPYESAGVRADEIYRELVPPLARLARQFARKLIIKLHPFESITQRERLVRTILDREDRVATRLIDGPLSQVMLLETWFGVTVESSTALDCASQGVPCFLCHWLALSPYGYVQQYARFGVGYGLHSPDQIPSIPLMLANIRSSPTPLHNIWQPIEPNLLRRYLAGIGRMVDTQEEQRKAIVAT